MLRFTPTGIFTVQFSGILNTVSVFPANYLLHCGDLRTTLAQWFVNLRNLFEREVTTTVKLIILATLAITQECLITYIEAIGITENHSL